MKVSSKQISCLCDILWHTSRALYRAPVASTMIHSGEKWMHSNITVSYWNCFCKYRQEHLNARCVVFCWIYGWQVFTVIALITWSNSNLMKHCFFAGADAFREWTAHGRKTTGTILVIPSLWGNYLNLFDSRFKLLLACLHTIQISGRLRRGHKNI